MIAHRNACLEVDQEGNVERGEVNEDVLLSAAAIWPAVVRCHPESLRAQPHCRPGSAANTMSLKLGGRRGGCSHLLQQGLQW